eukprot:CAMPEP_0119152440 /NCGR_PEP_ID=MMETSP1310-20130426/47801_1 /TAXON_ID=464262 /ORGANISM="Genus nov. species nov., Strain RCC2339" /LENGTH=813 /DNA_ID=CAMNT_0007144801 /DNA_START=194 /DNA_END=2631 /DNA_ORIENTATION=+
MEKTKGVKGVVPKGRPKSVVYPRGRSKTEFEPSEPLSLEEGTPASKVPLSRSTNNTPEESRISSEGTPPSSHGIPVGRKCRGGSFVKTVEARGTRPKSPSPNAGGAERTPVTLSSLQSQISQIALNLKQDIERRNAWEDAVIARLDEADRSRGNLEKRVIQVEESVKFLSSAVNRSRSKGFTRLMRVNTSSTELGTESQPEIFLLDDDEEVSEVDGSAVELRNDRKKKKKKNTVDDEPFPGLPLQDDSDARGSKSSKKKTKKERTSSKKKISTRSFFTMRRSEPAEKKRAESIFASPPPDEEMSIDPTPRSSKIVYETAIERVAADGNSPRNAEDSLQMFPPGVVFDKESGAPVSAISSRSRMHARIGRNHQKTLASTLNEGEEVPMFLAQALDYLTQPTIVNTPRMFVDPVSPVHLAAVKEKIGKGKKSELGDILRSLNSPKTVCQVLIDFLDDLSEPLITSDLYDAILQLSSIPSEKLRLEVLRMGFYSMPLHHRKSLRYLLNGLKFIQEHGDPTIRKILPVTFGEVILKRPRPEAGSVSARKRIVELKTADSPGGEEGTLRFKDDYPTDDGVIQMTSECTSAAPITEEEEKLVREKVTRIAIESCDELLSDIGESIVFAPAKVEAGVTPYMEISAATLDRLILALVDPVYPTKTEKMYVNTFLYAHNYIISPVDLLRKLVRIYKTGTLFDEGNEMATTPRKDRSATSPSKDGPEGKGSERDEDSGGAAAMSTEKVAAKEAVPVAGGAEDGQEANVPKIEKVAKKMASKSPRKETKTAEQKTSLKAESGDLGGSGNLKKSRSAEPGLGGGG